MTDKGMVRTKKKRQDDRLGARRSAMVFASKETRLFEMDCPGMLWHLDGHKSKFLQVLDEKGRWLTPLAIANIDDHSRLICHMQWYSTENSEYLVHSTQQAMLKRGVPWELMSDNGSAMTSHEFTQGLTRLSVEHDFTLPYTPQQNAKLERFWGTVEAQLMAMLEHNKQLTMRQLNDATQAWVELGYNRAIHSELGCSPAERYSQQKNRHRECPSTEELVIAFSRQVTRKPRKTDSSISIEGVRFEVPWQYRHIPKLIVRYVLWDLSRAWLMDERGDNVICRIRPVNLLENSSGKRKYTPENNDSSKPDSPKEEIAPLLKKMMEDYAATGLPAAWLPTREVADE